jgi:hypothetical protein
VQIKIEKTRKAPATEASRSGCRIEDGPDIVGEVYNDTSGLLEKGEDLLRWGGVDQMFKKKSFTTNAKDQDKIGIFKNIKQSKIHRVESCIVVFSWIDSITWILSMWIWGIFIYSIPWDNL